MALGQANAALAQDQTATDVTTADEGGDEAIVVTGSRIRRPDFSSPNPVMSIGAQDIQESGTTNLTDFLTGFPALVGSSTSGDNSGSGAGIGATGLNLLDLRNLGTKRTLTLVNGRRHVAGVPGEQAVDINTIPSDLVSRVDVLTGGASAIYGADGVTGVVNFILRDDFEGVSARAQTGISQRGDASQMLVAVTAGTNFADGRGNVAVAYEFGKDSRLETRDRKYLTGTDRIGFYLNPDDPENQGDYTGPSDNGIPDYIPLRDVRYYDTAREGGIDVDWDGMPDYIVNSNGQVVPFDGGRFIPDFYQQGGNATSISDYGNDLLPAINRHVVNAIAHFEVSPALTLFAEGKYARSKSFSLGQPSFDYYLVMQPDNPYIPDALKNIAEENGGVLLTRDNFDLGQRGENIKRETYRFVGGARGDITDSLSYELSYTYGKTKVENRYIANVLNDRFYAALDVVTGPNGQPTCRVNVDPNWSPFQPYNSTREALDPTTFRPGECVPMNLFGENKMSPEARAWVTTDTTDRSAIEQHVISGAITGELFKLPGGPVGFAIGGEYRKEKSSFTPDALAAQGLTFTNALGVEAGKYDVKEAFAEVRLPLFKDVPFAHRLEFGGAVRLSDYSTIGTTTTWKADGTWAPISEITFAGTYSVAVRAPNISEMFAGQSQTFQFIKDPCLPNQLQNGTEYRQGNCNALLAGLGVTNPGTYTDVRSTNISGFVGGNRNLSEEKAKTWTAGVILQPSFIKGLSLRADWYDIRLKNAINVVTPEEVAELCVDQATLDNPFCSSIVRQNGGNGDADAGNIVSFNVGPQNVSQFRTAGLDVNLNYVLNTDSAGRFNLNVRGNYLDKLEFIGTPGAPVTDNRGVARAPKYMVNMDLGWKKGAFGFNYGLSWWDKTARFANQTLQSNTDVVEDKYKYYKQRWVHDIYASVDVTEQFQVYGGINNLFDTKPAIGSASNPVSAVGRYFFVGAKAKLGKIF